MITVVTTHGRFTIEEAQHWARDADRDVHLYRDPNPANPRSVDGGDSLATVEGARFVAAYETEHAVNPTSELKSGDGFDRNPNTPDR